MDFSLMIGNCVFHDGKTQAGATGGFGMAFVYPVEPLKAPMMVSRFTRLPGKDRLHNPYRWKRRW